MIPALACPVDAMGPGIVPAARAGPAGFLLAATRLPPWTALLTAAGLGVAAVETAAVAPSWREMHAYLDLLHDAFHVAETRGVGVLAGFLGGVVPAVAAGLLFADRRRILRLREPRAKGGRSWPSSFRRCFSSPARPAASPSPGAR